MTLSDTRESRSWWLFGALLALVVFGAAIGASDHLEITGDEPHYLFITASVLRDLDFDVRNNYLQDAITHEIYRAPLIPHALMRDTGWWPQHQPGLGVLLAIPFGLGGPSGARVALATLLIPLLGLAVYRWSRTCLPPADAGFATIGVMACSPVVFGASQIYPDLPGGLAVFALVGWLWGTERRTRLGWCIYWCVAGLLCWLHVKYYAPSAVLLVAGAWQLWRDPVRFTPATYVAFGLLFSSGPALFGAFSVPVFGNMLGGRGGGELSTDIPRAIEIVLGLHLDQIHGLFVQQPLFVPGLVALGWMIRRRHPLTLPWLVLYASLVVPNALLDVPQLEYGGPAAPAGRFGWTAMWLWLIPLALAGRESLTRRSRQVVWLTVLAGIAYQAALAVAWVPDMHRLFNGLFRPQQWQPSLFPASVMLSLPKFGNSYGGAGYPPNFVWTSAAFALLAAGLLHPWKLRYLPASAVAVLALFVLPVEDALERSGSVLRRYEAEHSPFTCTVSSQVGASNGQVCSSRSSQQFAVAGPFISLDPGTYEIVAAVEMMDGTPAAGSLQVVSSRGNHSIARRNFQLLAAAGKFWVMLPFAVERKHYEVEFRLLGTPELAVDYIDLRPRAVPRRARSGARRAPGNQR